jgi:high-affinity nickel-transport protein
MHHEFEAVLPGLTLALVMGLRHGLAPDHLAAIDGLTARAVAARPRQARWMGAMFACGHAAAVLLIVLAASLTSAWVTPYEAVVHWIALAPPVFLLALAAMNARQLLRAPATALAPSAAATAGCAHGRLARWLPRTVTLRSAAVVGALFALGFESAFQAIAWGYAATAAGSPGGALLVAAVFTGGMAITDSLDGWIAARMLTTGSPARMAAFRRRLGWPIVALCVVSAGVMLLPRWLPHGVPVEETCQAIGGAIVVATIAAYALALRAAARDGHAGATLAGPR